MYSLATKSSENVAVATLEEKGLITGPFKRETQLANRKRYLLNPMEAGALLWDEARGGGHVGINKESTHLLNNLHLRVDSSSSWIYEGVGKLIGFIKSSRAEEILRQQFSESSTRRQKQSLSLATKMPAAIVVPFSDMPGRITSLAFVYSAGRQHPWKSRLETITYGSISNPIVDGGIAMHPFTADTPADNRLLLTSDLATYLKMHTKHFAGNTKPLQLACYHNAEVKTKNWSFVRNRDLVLWTNILKPQDLYLAMEHNAKIAIYGPTNETIPLYSSCRHVQPSEVYKACIENAKPWEAQLASIMNHLDMDELSEWLIKMSLSVNDERKLLDACTKPLQEKLKRAIGKTGHTRVVDVADGTVEQRAGGWYHVREGKNPELITNAPFWIDYAVHETHQTKVEQIYGVKVAFRDREITFEAPLQKFHRDPFQSVQEALIAQGVGAPAFSPTWKNKALQISLQMHQPETIRRSSVIGFSKNDSCFHLPDCTIDIADGQVRKVTSGNVAGLPGRGLGLRRVFDEHVENFLSQPSSEVYLAIFASMLSQVLAASADLPRPKLLFRSRSLRHPVSQVAHLLGVPLIADQKYSAIQKAAALHNWPIVAGIPDPISDTIRRKLLADQGSSSICLQVNLEEQLYGELSRSAVTLEAPGIVTRIPPEVLRCLQAMAGDIIQYYCREQKMSRLYEADNIAIGVVGLMSDWAKSRGISRNQFRPVNDLIFGGINASSNIPRSIGLLMVTGRMKLMRVKDEAHLQQAIRKHKDPLAYQIGDATDLFIPRGSLIDSLAAGNAPQLDIGELTSRLSTEGDKIRVSLQGSTYGFMVPRGSVDWHVNRKKAAARQLRVVG